QMNLEVLQVQIKDIEYRLLSMGLDIDAPNLFSIIENKYNNKTPLNVRDKSGFDIPFYETVTINNLDDVQRKAQPNSFVKVPGLTDLDFATRVWSDFVNVSLRGGDIILCKFIKKDKDWSYVRYGERYLAICDDGPALARIAKSTIEG